MDLVERARGLLVGMAVGDALGLPREGLEPGRAARLWGPPLRHAFWLGRGVVSDDTEHAFLTAQAVLASRGEEAPFARALGWRLRGWLATLPPGVGWATLRACALLCLGASVTRSGRRSAGNGPLMRAPLLGFAVPEPRRRAALVEVSTRATHTHPLALEAARAIAELAAAARDGEHRRAALFALATRHLRDAAWRAPLARLEHALTTAAEPGDWARTEGLERGVTGYVVHTVPAVLFSWLRAPRDYPGAVATAIELGGDADTVAAIVGALAGAVAGRAAIPRALVDGIVDWPLAPPRLDALALRLVDHLEGRPSPPLRTPFGPLRLVRNLAVGAAAIAHVLWRIAAAAAGVRRRPRARRAVSPGAEQTPPPPDG